VNPRNFTAIPGAPERFAAEIPRESLKNVTPEEGGWRADKRNSCGSCLAARGRLSARQQALK
jgi:hypothetical protein